MHECIVFIQLQSVPKYVILQTAGPNIAELRDTVSIILSNDLRV